MIGFIHLIIKDFLRISSLGKYISSTPPFLCKSLRVRMGLLVFDSHFVHDQASDVKQLCFYIFIYIQIHVWLCIFLVLEHKSQATRKAFIARNEVS